MELGAQTRKLHLLQWNKLIHPKEEGGLNLYSLKSKNQSLLGKWWFKWFADRDANWNKIICSKYGCVNSNSIGEALSGKNLSGTLQSIISMNNDQGFNQLLSSENFEWVIGDGCSVLFWEDKWNSIGKLSTQYARLYSLSKLRFVSVKSFRDAWFHPDTISSGLWSRDLRAWELEEALNLNNIIEELNLEVRHDQVVWIPTGKPYCAKDGKNVLRNSLYNNSQGIQGAWSIIWNFKIPPKIQLFFVENGTWCLAF